MVTKAIKHSGFSTDNLLCGSFRDLVGLDRKVLRTPLLFYSPVRCGQP